ncbi:hypothetical protein VPH35_127180 [Triticum aestivum]
MDESATDERHDRRRSSPDLCPSPLLLPSGRACSQKTRGRGCSLSSCPGASTSSPPCNKKVLQLAVAALHQRCNKIGLQVPAIFLLWSSVPAITGYIPERQIEGRAHR